MALMASNKGRGMLVSGHC